MTLQNDEYWFENEIFSIALPVNHDLDSLTNGQEVTLEVRPQYIELEPEEPLFEAELNVVESHGPSDAVYLDVNGQPITSVVDQGAVDRSVKAIEVGFTIDKAWIFDRTGERIV